MVCRRGVDEAGPLATVFILFTQHTVCQLTLAGLKVGTGSGPGLQKPAAEEPGVFIPFLGGVQAGNERKCQE